MHVQQGGGSLVDFDVDSGRHGHLRRNRSWACGSPAGRPGTSRFVVVRLRRVLEHAPGRPF